MVQLRAFCHCKFHFLTLIWVQVLLATIKVCLLWTTILQFFPKDPMLANLHTFIKFPVYHSCDILHPHMGTVTLAEWVIFCICGMVCSTIMCFLSLNLPLGLLFNVMFVLPPFLRAASWVSWLHLFFNADSLTQTSALSLRSSTDHTHSSQTMQKVL